MCGYTASISRYGEAAFGKQWESNPGPAGDVFSPAIDGSSTAACHAAASSTGTSSLLGGVVTPHFMPIGAPRAIRGLRRTWDRSLHAGGPLTHHWTRNRAGGPRWAHSGAPKKDVVCRLRVCAPQGPLTLREAEALELRAQTEKGLRLPVLPWLCFGCLLAAPLALAHYHATRLQQRQQRS
ncbi:hypothetical protein ACSSS7_004525 [Eimeria intestinalis]